MEVVTVENIIEYLHRIRKTLLIGIVTLLLAITVRAYFEDFKMDIKYLQDSYSKLRNEIEEKSLIEANGIADLSKQYEFKEWSEIEMEKVVRQVQSLSDNIQKSKSHSGIKEEEFTRFDLALNSAGGRIVSYHNTRLLEKCSIITILLGACNRNHPPEKVIDNSMSPGHCFCFLGNQGEFTIQMACEAVLDGVTLEHIPQSMTPTNDISSAPKIFNLTGLKDLDDENGFNFGEFKFDPKVKTKKAFTLPIKSDEKFKFIKVSVTDNHGNANETCMYRIQLHGFVESC